MKELLTVKANVDLILSVEPEEVKGEKSQVTVKRSVRRMRSRTNGALWGIWGSPQQAEAGRFSLRRKSPGLPKGYHTALLATVWFRFAHSFALIDVVL